MPSGPAKSHACTARLQTRPPRLGCPSAFPDRNVAGFRYFQTSSKRSSGSGPKKPAGFWCKTRSLRCTRLACTCACCTAAGTGGPAPSRRSSRAPKVLREGERPSGGQATFPLRSLLNQRTSKLARGVNYELCSRLEYFSHRILEYGTYSSTFARVIFPVSQTRQSNMYWRRSGLCVATGQ